MISMVVALLLIIMALAMSLDSSRQELKRLEAAEALCSLALRAKVIAFSDPGDAVRWAKDLSAWRASANAYYAGRLEH